jgi:hypothetical protein
MIQELTQSHYWGVLCSRCKERIPVPGTTAVLYAQLKRGEVSEGQDTKSRAFTLRCKVCDEESVYGVKEFLEFEGSPRVRTSERTSVVPWVGLTSVQFETDFVITVHNFTDVIKKTGMIPGDLTAEDSFKKARKAFSER